MRSSATEFSFTSATQPPAGGVLAAELDHYGCENVANRKNAHTQK